MAKKVAIYARVSTRDKKNGNDEYRQNPETQLIPCREFCQRMGWRYREYVDRISGSKEDRPALKQLVEDARLKKFDVVVFYKLDRLARSTKHLIQLIDFFGSKQIDVVSIRDPIDTTTPSGKLLFHIMAAIAEFERELIRERVRDGIERAKREGKQIGRPKKKFNVGLAMELRKMGYSYKQIANMIGVSKAVVYRRLNSVSKTSLE